SLNALTAGCNQKNNRDPVLAVSDAEAQAAIDRLKPLLLVIESSGSRVMRYSHNVGRVLRVSSEAVALLATLCLRGPQTAAELRLASERLHRFADVSSVEGFLRQLAERALDAGGPLVVLLPRSPGAREPRWAHLLSGPVKGPICPAEGAPRGSDDASELAGSTDAEVALLRDEVACLSAELATLRTRVAALEGERNVERGSERGSERG
ncbi:MAG: YceH family protein, partial [Candidatus Binataceae bacterium]